MSTKKKETHFNLESPVMIVNKEPMSISSRTRPQAEKPVAAKVKKLPMVMANLLPYTPPDVLMFALFSAIQRKAWPRARKLCYELIICDPVRKTYRDLYYQIDQIIKIIDQRVRPKAVVISRTATVVPSRPASSGSTNSDDDL